MANHSNRLNGRRALLLFAIAGGGLMLLASGTVKAATGSGCVSVEVDTPIRLPDGTLHPSGRLTLCDSRKLSPVSTLHKTYVNGQPVGMLVGHRRSSEGGERISPAVFFDVDEQGHLELSGYVLPAGGRSVTYTMGGKWVSGRDFELASQARRSRQLTAMVAGTPR